MKTILTLKTKKMNEQIKKEVYLCPTCKSPNILEKIWIPSNNFDLKYLVLNDDFDRIYCNECDESSSDLLVHIFFDTNIIKSMDNIKLTEYLTDNTTLSENQIEILLEHRLSLTNFQMIGYDAKNNDKKTIYVYEDGKDSLIKITKD